MPEKRPIRGFDGSVIFPLEVRVQKNSKMPQVLGTFAYGELSHSFFGAFRERIEPGAADESIERGEIMALLGHQKNFVLGRQDKGTLEVTSTEREITMKADPPTTTWVSDMFVSVERGDIDGISPGFDIPQPAINEKWSIEDGETVRSLKVINVGELSLTSMAAYPVTGVKVVRDMMGAKDSDHLAELLGAIVRLEHGLELTTGQREAARAFAKRSLPAGIADPGDGAPFVRLTDLEELRKTFDDSIEGHRRQLEGLQNQMRLALSVNQPA
jgi:HK97 family phage prohead protease